MNQLIVHTSPRMSHNNVFSSFNMVLSLVFHYNKEPEACFEAKKVKFSSTKCQSSLLNDVIVFCVSLLFKFLQIESIQFYWLMEMQVWRFASEFSRRGSAIFSFKWKAVGYLQGFLSMVG